LAGRGVRTDLDGFLLHLLAHVSGLDLGCAARSVYAHLVAGTIGVVRATGSTLRTVDLVLRGQCLLLVMARHIGQSVSGDWTGLVVIGVR
jgi:hypothetical protein